MASVRLLAYGEPVPAALPGYRVLADAMNRTTVVRCDICRVTREFEESMSMYSDEPEASRWTVEHRYWHEDLAMRLEAFGHEGIAELDFAIEGWPEEEDG